MANDAPEAPDTTITLTVSGARVVAGHQPGETFVFELGKEGTDAREANARQLRSWVMGGHVVDPVLATRKRKRKTKGGD